MSKLFPDLWLTLPVVALLLISLVTLSSIASHQAVMQLVFAVVSLAAFFVVSKIGIEYLQPFKNIIYVACLAFLVAPLIFGIASRGATSWLQFGQISLQPSELVKPFLLLVYCQVAASKTKAKFLKLVALFLPPAGLIFIQPDFGTVAVLAAGWLVIVTSGFNFRQLLASGVFLVLAGTILVIFGLREYQKSRLVAFLNPHADPLGAGYHVIQSMIAVGSGGLDGRGLGRGSQSALRFLPENHTDFIFASLAESFGFVGSALVIILYLVYFSRLYQLSQVTADPVASLWLLSCLTMLSFQTLINIGMNLGVAPVTGITLPFLSYGGSSLLSNTLITALANSLSRGPKARLV